MSTNKNIDRICCVILVISIVIALLAMGFNALDNDGGMIFEYNLKLFDDSYVHTVEIQMDDWDSFISSCENEEYSVCDVTIDGEMFKNVAIRAKGNTSLSSVSAYGNDRYSFKIEFDHYESNNYYGLDKLSLNNLIQDNTYMKDYLVYTMMREQGVASPLCSFTSFIVNGENKGLYLAVEGVEESFLKRNYGSDYGELYKPDSVSAGGGRGNGKEFSQENVEEPEQSKDATETSIVAETSQADSENAVPQNELTKNQAPQTGEQTPLMPDSDMTPPEGLEIPQRGEMPNGGEFAQNADSFQNGDNNVPPEGFEIPGRGEMPNSGEFVQNADSSESSENNVPPEGFERPENLGGFQKDNMGGGMSAGIGSSDVLLKYIDENYSSYSNIFDNAKTDITDGDKDRLISSLKSLNSGENIESCVDADAVIKYFAVHNFVCNFDSYTGQMIHNYYLYENDGVLSMIPWDYNLAFGGFMSGSDADSLVNFPVDSPVSGGDTADRPMIAWIFENAEYTELYHKYLSEFIENIFDSGWFETKFTQVQTKIAPYVKNDTTAFCTYDEFTKGSDALKTFCTLRAESVKGQLSGNIPSTSDEQNKDKSAFIDTGDLNINSMGSMGAMGFGNRKKNETTEGSQQNTQNAVADSSSESVKSTENSKENSVEQGGAPFNKSDLNNRTSNENGDNTPSRNSTNPQSYIAVGGSMVILIAALVFVLVFKRRK